MINQSKNQGLIQISEIIKSIIGNKMIKYHMDMPPSLNKARACVRGRLISTADYREWLRITSWELSKQKNATNEATMTHDVELSVVLYPKTKRRQDVDNRTKGIFDVLVKAEILKDDSQIKKLTIEFDYSKKDCVEVFIFPYFPRIAYKNT